jgi:hypothetical protein
LFFMMGAECAFVSKSCNCDTDSGEETCEDSAKDSGVQD